MDQDQGLAGADQPLREDNEKRHLPTTNPWPIAKQVIVVTRFVERIELTVKREYPTRNSLLARWCDPRRIHHRRQSNNRAGSGELFGNSLNVNHRRSGVTERTDLCDAECSRAP